MSDYAEHQSYSEDHLAPDPYVPMDAASIAERKAKRLADIASAGLLPCSWCGTAGYLFGRVLCPTCNGTGSVQS